MKNILILSAFLLATTATAETTLIKKDGAEVKANAEISMGTMFANGAQYGAGSADTRNTDTRRKSPKWIESYVKPGLTGNFDVGNGSAGYAGLSVVGTKNYGKGEPNLTSTTSYEPGLLAFEDAFVGWKSGSLLKHGKDLIDFSMGNQSFTLGDGFIIADGTNDAGKRAAYYLGPRTAFRETAILKINTSPVRFKFFHLQNNTNQRWLRGGDQPRTWLNGADVEWFKLNEKEEGKDLWTVGTSLIHVYKADRTVLNPAVNANRDGLMIYNARMGGYFIPGNHDIRFMSGVVHQDNGHASRKVSANAYYLEPAYTFSKLWAKPTLSYRYTYYSGDKSPGSEVKKSYDSLFPSTGRCGDIGIWQVGDVFGQYVSGNSNLRIQQIQTRFVPTENTYFGLLYLNINFDRPTQALATSRKAANEFNLFGGWTPYKWLELCTLLGVSVPGRGIKESIRAAVPTIDPSIVNRSFYFGKLTAKMNF